ncbi:uncharacterized protein LOC131633361 [Vicia villosa]|uniref:uncharacterized protein LOC131633361 n=1 Tax=Vicia villosa TaxID=3911 RepID=UPI00273B49FF|nr:uncharacterized protein LOC131633361 [Vicia villosa]
MPTLTTNNQAAFRQEMDASNHDMVGVLAREMGSIFSPLITNLNRTNQDNVDTYQRLSTQIGRIAYFLGGPQTSTRRRNNQVVIQGDEPVIGPVLEPVRPPRQRHDETNPGAELEQQARRTNSIRQEIPEEQPRVVMVNREKNADDVIHKVRRDNMAIENNLTILIERIMANNDLNTRLRCPNYTSPVTDYILQTELPRGDLANSENLRIKYFPSSLTKNAFTWFTTLPLNSIDTWAHLERMFHEQFYMGQTNISLKELASIKRKFTKPIDDYLNRFRLLKSRYFIVVPEHESVEMAAGCLDYSI